MTLEQQNTELQQRIMELMRENRFLKNEFTAVRSSLGIIKESTDATHQIIVDLEQQNAELLRQNAELLAKNHQLKTSLLAMQKCAKESQCENWTAWLNDKDISILSDMDKLWLYAHADHSDLLEEE